MVKSGMTIKKDALVAYGHRYYAAATGKSGKTAVLVFLLNGGTRGGDGWGYKDIDEFMGPTDVDCPLSVLDAADPVEAFAGDYREDGGLKSARDWRARVRAYHAARATARSVAKAAKPGDKIWLKGGGDPYVVTRIDGKRLLADRGYVTYRIPKTRIVRHEPKVTNV
jgi:hypothetical protein